ncbi:MAG: ATP-binding cassette domain-containing protein, partial [Actinomycetota bacterium]
MNNKIILRAENISKGYGNSRVLDLERLEIYRGETLCILGPNGAGKSTLVRILNLVEEPDSGDVWFDGARVGHRDVQARRRMAGVFQRPHMLKGTVYGNV